MRVGCRIPIKLMVRLTRVEGTLLAWIPPPPGDRLWSAFVELPHLHIEVKPVVLPLRPMPRALCMLNEASTAGFPRACKGI